jgi:hypothetical protein
MSGDYSRDRFDPTKNYGRVRQQQGRVALDSDWNEAADIQDRRWRAETLDLMGRCAVSPRTPDAFKIHPSADGRTFEIGLGRLYVDGLLAENFGTGAETFDPVLAEARAGDRVPYTDQPYLPAEPLPAHGRYLVYLDVWEREVTHVEDPGLLEPALRGVDTTTRLQTLWQVRTLPLADTSAGCSASLDEATVVSSSRLSVSFDESLVTDDPCELPPTGGYRGAENHLYRLQIHDGGGLSQVATGGGQTGATFKWSRDNASTVIPVRSMTGRKLSLASLGRDQTTGICIGDWVEILDDHREFRQESGDLAKVTEINEGTQEITLDRDIPLSGKRPFAADPQGHSDRHTRLCKWNQSEGLSSEGTVPINVGSIHLENGVQVAFNTQDEIGGNGFRSGDYWLFAARPGNAGFDLLDQAPPRGIHHHYCRLAVIDHGADGIKIIEDCRPHRGDRMASCCVVTVGDGVVSQGDFTNDIQGAIDAVSEGGKVCILEGQYDLSATLRVNKANLTLLGCGRQSLIRRASGKTHKLQRSGFPLLSIEADGISIRDLSFDSAGFPNIPGGSTRSALSAKSISSLTIADCVILNGGGSAIDILASTEVRISDCEIRGYPALLARQCIDVRIDNNRVSSGGIWIGTGSQSISITRNRISYGKGPGILLGDSREPSVERPSFEALFLVKHIDVSFAEPSSRLGLIPKETLNETLISRVIGIAKPGSIQQVQLKDNVIEGMGGSGISTLYKKSLNTLEDAADLDSVDDLEIVGNRIVNCVQDKPDCRFPDQSLFGAGILLAGSSDVRIRRNHIASNGCDERTKEKWPACGILLGDCAEVDITDNHCVDNGVRNDPTADEKFLQAELALLYVKSRAPSRDAARIVNNVVRCKAGQAIIALSTGNLSIIGNTLESLSYRAQPLIVSQSAQNALQDLLKMIARCASVLLLQYSYGAGPPFSHPSLLMLNGNRIMACHGTSETVANVHGLTDVPQDVYASIGVLSAIGDVSIANNQSWYDAPGQNATFTNTFVVCGGVRAVGNFFSGLYNGYSYQSHAVDFNIATNNMSSLHLPSMTQTTSSQWPNAYVRTDNNLP